jgi:hypothetical protein
MRFLTRRFVVMPWSGVLPAFLAILFIGDTEVRAGCAHHSVTSQTQSMRLSAHLERVLTSGAVHAPGSQSPQNRPVPCSGALCSGFPAAPDSTLPFLAPVNGDPSAIAPVPSTQPIPASFAGLSVESSPSTSDHSAGIFHPPRHLASPDPF